MVSAHLGSILVATAFALVATGSTSPLAGTASVEVPICAIQGDGPSPRHPGTRVTTRGVVIADFTGTSLRGFFLQEPACDGNPATSDGLWVDVGERVVRAPEGHRLSVTGWVSNDFGLTRIHLDSAADLGADDRAIEVVRLAVPSDPATAAVYLESLEGMLVALPAARVVAATNHFGEAYLMPSASGVTRLFRGQADGRKLGLLSPAAWLALDHGDVVMEAVGPLAYTFGEFKVMLRPSRPAAVTRAGSPPAPVPAVPPGGLGIATCNLENLFDPVDDPDKDDADATPTPEQYAVALARRAASIARLLGSPDVLAVQEVEKLEVLQDLAAQPDLLPAAYLPVLVEGLDVRGIDVGLLFRSDRLWLRSWESRPACTDLRTADGPTTPCALPGGAVGVPLFARPPLVVRLERLDNRERLTFIVNHFKSQRGDDASDERVRLAQADHVRSLAAELTAAEPSAGVVVLGDLNDFEDSATLARLTADGALVDLSGRADPRPYTYVFQGLSQVLDYVLVDRALAPRMREVRPAHVNVDYADPGPLAGSSPTPRVSDHDPVIAIVQ